MKPHKILFVLSPAYVACMGNYEGNMPTSVQRVSAHAFQEIGPVAKQVENWNDPDHSFVHVPNSQGTQGHYDSFGKERLFEGSNVKSDSKDCQTSAESADTYKPSASVPNLSGFGQPSPLYESRIGIFNNAQPASQLAYTSFRSGSTLMRNPEVPDFKPSKPFRGESRYKVPKSSTAGSEVFVVQAPENVYGHMEFKSQVARDPLARGPSFVSSLFSHHHGSSQGTGKVQIASSTYSPFWRDTPVHSSNNSRKPHGGLQFQEAKPSIVSSGPVFVVHGGVSAPGHVDYIKHLNSVKPLGFSHHVDPYVSQESQTSRHALTAGSQPSMSRHKLHYSMMGSRYSSSHEPKKPSGSDCRDNDGKLSIASSDEILLSTPVGALDSKFPPHKESYEAVRHPRKFQQTYSVHVPSQNRFPIYSSVSGSQPNQILEPLHPSRSGAQYNVAKSSVASSGAILMMQAPTNVQSRTGSNKAHVPSKPHTSLPERRVTFASDQITHQFQPVQTSQNSRPIQGSISTYPSSSQSGEWVFSSVKGAPYKPGESSFRATKPSIAGSNEINTVRVRLHKQSTGSFGNNQNHWASGDNVGASCAHSGASRSYQGQRPGQNVQTSVSSSIIQNQGSKGAQIQSAQTRGNEDIIRFEISTIPNRFGQGVIRRISPTLPSSNRQALQNQAQVQRVDSSGPRCDKTQNGPLGLRQQSPATFQT